MRLDIFGGSVFCCLLEVGVWYSSAGLGGTDLGCCDAGYKQRRGGCRRYLKERERRNANVGSTMLC